MTVGFSPADLKNLVNQAVINSIKRQSFIAEFNDFQESFEKIKLGIKSSQVMEDQNVKKQVALKESAKAIYALMNKDMPKPSKVTMGIYGE